MDANKNRSPAGYYSNPKELRDYYEEEGDTDKNMTILLAEDSMGNLDGLMRFISDI